MEVLEAVDDPRADLIGLDGGVAILAHERHVKGEPSGWTVTGITQRATLRVHVRDARERLLALSLHPVLAVRGVRLVLQELDDDGLLVNLQALCVRGVSLLSLLHVAPASLDDPTCRTPINVGLRCRSRSNAGLFCVVFVKNTHGINSSL